MLSVDQAFESILSTVAAAPAASVSLSQAYDQCLAADLATPHDSPPFDKSMMDGFAVVAEPQPQTLQVLETITAGTVPQATVTPGTACRIMTGAPMPAGANCVVPIEKVAFDESQPATVKIDDDQFVAEKHVLRQGASAQAGESLLAAGIRLRPQHIAALAEFGIAEIPVRPVPKVGVLATGDELLTFDEPLTPGRIRNSNEPMLISQITQAGAIPVPLGIARDNVADLKERIAAGLKNDFLVLTGGVSAGTLDLVPAELAAAGVVEVFHKIAMKPGKPLWFGRLQTEDHTCYVFGLPGNPVSSMVCFDLFVTTAMRQFCGQAAVLPAYRSVQLTAPIAVRGDREIFMPCQFEVVEGVIQATAVRWGGSADLRSTATAHGLCRLSPECSQYEAGQTVPAVIWSWS